MSNTQTGRPSILANLILMALVGGMLFGFFYLLRSCEEKAGNARVTPYTEENKEKAAQNTEEKKVAVQPEPTKEEIAKTVAEANQVRKTQPVVRSDEEQTSAPSMPAVPTPTTPSTQPAIESGTPAATQMTSPQQPSSTEVPPTISGGDDVLPPKEPVREVATNSSEGNALLKDASARVDEAPSELYSDKAKAKVREGLAKARRIFKVHTVYFEKGGAKVSSSHIEELKRALTDDKLLSVMDDPTSVFFVLGFADRSGSADLNKKLSKDRADAVIDMLKKAGTLNLTYPVAIGSTELVAPENQNKNRAAEVWLVLP